jgi:hypothetical protein
MLSTGTVNETTLATGASVPTTNAGPDSVVRVPVPVELVKALVQPAINNAAAVNETNAIGKDLTSVLDSIVVTPLSALELVHVFWSTNAEQANSRPLEQRYRRNPVSRKMRAEPACKHSGDLWENLGKMPLSAFGWNYRQK